MYIKLIVSAFLLLMTTVSCAQKQELIEQTTSDTDGYTTQTVVPDLDIPWGMTWLPDGSMLITEKNGELIRYENENKILIKNVPEVYVRGQGGLMDIALHPQYSENGWIYMTFSSQKGDGDGGNTTLVRAKLSGDSLTSIETLYKATPNTTRGIHFGSRIEFDNDGYLYFSIGDRGNRAKTIWFLLKFLA